jgi:membrane protein implicated in regulation of membrane protease activity
LILLSAVGVVTGVAASVYLGWRVGLAGFGALVVVLALFLRWEMRRRTSRRTAAARQARAAVTEPNSP